MRMRIASLAAASLFVYLATSINSAAFGVADLSDWTGERNVQPNASDPFFPNNYTLNPNNTSAGGTFRARRSRQSATEVMPATLSDPSLQGSTVALPDAYGFNDNLAASGTLTFANPNNVDAVIFFGFFNGKYFIDPDNGPGSFNGIHRLGLGFGDETTNVFRVQSQAGSGASPILSNSLTTTGNAPSPAHDPVAHVPAGTYSFSFEYTAATRLFKASITNGTTTWKRENVTLPITFFDPDAPEPTTDVLTRFGFLQFTDQGITTDPTAAELLTFDFSVSNIDYTGSTQLPGSTPGDFNNDTLVNAADLDQFKLDFGATRDGNDYLVWQRNLNMPSVSAVPEPSCVALAVLAMAGACWRGDARRRVSALA